MVILDQGIHLLSSNVLHYRAKCPIDVVHRYSYPLAQFDENYTSIQFVETILWLNLMKLYVFQIDGQNVRLHQRPSK